MAVLVALVYPDQAKAEEAATTAKGLEEAGWLTILDESLVTKDENGDVNMKERHMIRRGAVTGVVLGGLTGLIFAVPVVGIAAGAAVGAYVGKQRSDGATSDFHEFREQVAADLQPGGAALLLLAQTDARERVIQSLGRLGGTLRSTDFSEQQLAEIQAEIDRAAST
jgi:uncharacterized membrane protein